MSSLIFEVLIYLCEAAIAGSLYINLLQPKLKKRYIVLICFFTVLLAANMSEASFFSPGGGNAQWTPAVIGGFCLDMIAKWSHGLNRGNNIHA